MELSYLSNWCVCFADSDERVSIDRKVMRLSDPKEAEKIISGSPSVLRHVDPVEAGSDSDHNDFEKFISGFEAGNRDQTVVRENATVVRQHASQSVAVASSSRQPVASTSSQPVASTSRQVVPSRQAVTSNNRSVLPEGGNVLKPNAADGRQRNTAANEVCFEW